MKYQDIKTLRQLANYLRCEQDLLEKYLNGNILVSDKKNLKYLKSDDFDKYTLVYKFYIPKKNYKLGYRIVYKVIDDRLKNLLKILNSSLTTIYKPNSCVQGFIKDRNIKTNANAHLGNKYLLSLDLKDYFETISSNMIEKALNELGFDKAISSIISKLTTINNILVQGYNTSPTIANIVSTNLDNNLIEYCGKEIVYTRYADDLYFSSNTHIPSANDLSKIIEKHGFLINPHKTKLMKRGSKQYVTGLTVFDNKFPRIPKKIKRNLRLEIHYLKKHGFINHTCKILNYSIEDFEKSSDVNNEVIEKINSIQYRIEGWLAFINSIEPEKAAALYTEYNIALENEKMNRKEYKKRKERISNLLKSIKLNKN